jgi:hypothetical protein
LILGPFGVGEETLVGLLRQDGYSLLHGRVDPKFQQTPGGIGVEASAERIEHQVDDGRRRRRGVELTHGALVRV